MAYIGFDMDETLGSFKGVQGALFLMDPVYLYRFGPLQRLQEPPLSEETRASLQEAYKQFVNCISINEPAIGMLRPGILTILGHLQGHKESGRIREFAIYSNNPSQQILQFVSDLLERKLGRGQIFSKHIHAQSSLRNSDMDPTNPQILQKRLDTLKRIFETDGVDDEHFYFFDDVPHPDLKEKMGDRFFQVNPYLGPVNVKLIDECALKVLESTGLLTNTEYLNYIKPFFISSEKVQFDVLDMLTETENEVYKKINPDYPDIPDYPFSQSIRELILDKMQPRAEYVLWFLEDFNRGIESPQTFVNDRKQILAKLRGFFPPTGGRRPRRGKQNILKKKDLSQQTRKRSKRDK